MQSNQQQNRIGGLLPLKKDSRDFKYEGMFGGVAIESIPDNFTISDPLEIKDQGYSDMCVAFATVAVSEDQEKVPLSAEWFFSQIKKIQGNWKTWGADLRDGAKAAVKVGFIEEGNSPFSLKKEDRDFIANWDNWPVELQEEAQVHRKEAYFSVNSDFDSLRSALWQNRLEKRSILTGVLWESDWNGIKDGIIPDKSTGSEETPHAIKIFGQKKIGEKLYLVAQLSNSTDFGDKGIYYFPESIVNKKFKFGAYIFKDLDPENVKKISWNWRIRLYDFLIKLFSK